MALSESIEYDRIEVVGPFKGIQVRKATVIKKDGVEISRTHHRYCLSAGYLDESDNLVDTDISSEPSEVQAAPCSVQASSSSYRATSASTERAEQCTLQSLQAGEGHCCSGQAQ